MSFGSLSLPRVSPVVLRLIAATAVVQLLLETIITSPAISSHLYMVPGAVLTQPWSLITYMFVHGGLLHLITNMLMLYLFGTPVENRMGSRLFLLYYLYCGLGAAVFALGLSLLTGVSPFIGASGAVFGVQMAFAMFWPDAEIVVFPIPVPIRARTLVLVLAVIDLVAARLGLMPGVAHEAHLGGLAFGWLWFKMQGMGRRRPAIGVRPQVERVVVVQSASREAEPRGTQPARPMPRPGNDPVTAELDRVLDKISAKGIQSLTADEKRFLDEVSKRKQRELQ